MYTDLLLLLLTGPLSQSAPSFRMTPMFLDLHPYQTINTEKGNIGRLKWSLGLFSALIMRDHGIK
jgi:hypothetical protein